MYAVSRNKVIELTFASGAIYQDPFNDVDFATVFTGEDGVQYKVPGFWAGNNLWKVRFSSHTPGHFNFRTTCNRPSDTGLHGQTGGIDVLEYSGDNALYKHGPVVVSDNKRHFTHQDGTPFFWFADTWWMGLTKRLSWPMGFQTLTNDRVEKSFSVIQIIAGLYPDMPAFDERGVNEAGFPWETDYSSINPAYFDYADRRIEYLVEMGLAPCVVGCWGYYLSFTDTEKMKQHWKYLIARWAAYPVFWCLAGEGKMAYYMSDTHETGSELQCKGWTEVGRFVRETDPFHRLVTIHPTDNSRNQVEDPSILDFDMLQTGHGDRSSLPHTIRSITSEYTREPVMPVFNSEVCYEGIGESCRQEVQRLMFWTCMLSGACGHTYGANGIWQVNTREKPYGPSPHGMAWGNTPWEDAYQLPGSLHLGLAKKLLCRYEWWNMTPHPEWIDPCWSSDDYTRAYAAGIPGKLRIIYFPLNWWGSGIVKNIEAGVSYHAKLFNPATGEETDIGKVVPDTSGNWQIPLGNGNWKMLPIYQDWVVILEA